MSVCAIPDWTVQGVIPPINPLSPTAVDRSPYVVSLTDMVIRYGTSSERCQILDGLLRYREELHTAGLTRGFQWLDGSFLEHIEVLENRTPYDIDVVTFYHLPVGVTQRNLLASFPGLFDPVQTKTEFHVDGYILELKGSNPEVLIQQSTYWYSMWSHRRDYLWKGFLQIDLAPVEDVASRANLQVGVTAGGYP